MTDKSVYDEWQKLCDEYSVVRDAHFKALGAVNASLWQLEREHRTQIQMKKNCQTDPFGIKGASVIDF